MRERKALTLGSSGEGACSPAPCSLGLRSALFTREACGGSSPSLAVVPGLQHPLHQLPLPVCMASPPPYQWFLLLPHKLIALNSMLQGQHLGGTKQEGTHAAEERAGSPSSLTPLSQQGFCNLMPTAASPGHPRVSWSSPAPGMKLMLSCPTGNPVKVFS